jgi:hypothetical protein
MPPATPLARLAMVEKRTEARQTDGHGLAEWLDMAAFLHQCELGSRAETTCKLRSLMRPCLDVRQT